MRCKGLTRVLLRCGRSTGPCPPRRPGQPQAHPERNTRQRCHRILPVSLSQSIIITIISVDIKLLFYLKKQNNFELKTDKIDVNYELVTFRFTAADGSEHLVTYIADDKGYRVTGDAKLESGPTTTTEYVRPTQRATTQRPTTQRARTEAPVQKVIQLHRVVQLVQPVQTIQLVQLSQPIQLTQAVPVQSGVQLVQVQPKILSGSFQYTPVSYVQGFQSAETVTNPLLTRYYDYTVDGTQVYLTKRSIKTE